MKNLYSATKIAFLIIVFTLCINTIFQIPINETFKTALLMVLSFYFGQKTNQIVSEARKLTLENKDISTG